jgi:predicted O-linked N-acetylglucosamine transferase (SPINDLY family)
MADDQSTPRSPGRAIVSAPGRNDPCPCGSGRKYKHCCFGRTAAPAPARPAVQQAMHAAKEHHRAGRLGEAEALYRQVLQQAPDHADALNLLGLIAHQTGHYAAAAELIANAICCNGSIAGYHSNLGIVYHALGQFDRAIAAYETALAIEPDFGEAHYNLAKSYHELDRLEDAIAAYRRALAIKPGLAEAHYNLGTTLGRQGRLEEAAACFRHALAINPRYADAHCNLGFAYGRQGRPDDAVPCFRAALALQPDLAGALGNLALNLLAQGRPEEALECQRKPMDTNPAGAWAHSARLFTMLYLSACSPAEIYAAHRQFAERFENSLKPGWPQHANSADPERRLRVGYVSPNFHDHSVACFIEPILSHHDKSRFEVYAYSVGSRHDEVSERLAVHADHWLACASWPEERLAQRVRDDCIDVLVDLAGHTEDNRLMVFARKPAPVQVTYLGYAATTGLSAMDYRLVSADTDPPGAEIWHSERLCYLPHSLWCYRPRAAGAEIRVRAPAAHKGYVTFGSTNNIAKISPEAIAVWARVLGALPESRLIMTGLPEGSVRARLLERFAAHGIAAERIALHGTLPPPAFLELCSEIDIALDTFPYNGTTTTCEALWMGIPAICLIGQASVSRSGYAILKTAGLEALAAADADAYVQIACGLAQDLPRLEALRAGMRERLMSSPLRDENGMARDIESSFRDMWRQWCLTRPRYA